MSLTLPPVDRDALVATRRDLHQHPELGFQETRTSTLVAERLQSLGYQVKTGVGQTGVVAVKRVGGGGSGGGERSEEDTPELQSRGHPVARPRLAYKTHASRPA